jgi:tetratricopeptide (TPR) repeat protein
MNVPKLLKQAEKLASYGKVNEAINLYQEVLSENFHDTAVHNLIADLYISKQDIQRASRHLFKVAADYTTQGDQGAAVTVYQKIIKLLPRNILAREKLLEIFSKNGAKNEIFNLISELNTIYEGEGNTHKVIECLEKLVSLDPSNKNHRIKLALFLDEKGMKDKAVEMFSQIAQDFLREDRYEDALASLEKIKVIDPKDRNTSLRIAEVHEKQGKVQKAIEVIQSVVAEDPAQPIFLPYLAKLYVKARRIDEAEGIYEKLVSANKDFLPETLPFVEILIVHKKIDRAMRYIENLYQEIKDKEGRKKCAELLEEVLKLDPQNLAAYRILEAFYSSSFQFDQLAITLLSHADAYVAKCDYTRALDLAKQLVDLEPYNEEYRKKYQFIEKLSSGENRTLSPARSGPVAGPSVEDEADAELANAPVDSNFDQKVSLGSEEDVENLIVDIELLEKFGQQVNAIRRLEQVLKTYPLEIKLRQKLKTLYVDRKMPKKAAQECLEIAKILQSQDQKEEANRYLREAQRLNPLLSSAKRAAARSPADQAGIISTGNEEHVALKGDLSELGLLDVIQILDNAQKSGKLTISSDGNPGTIFFNSGRIVNATYQDKVGEPAMYALVAVKGGSFEYKVSSTAFEVVINNSNTNLLLEGLRLLDEANRDQGEGETPLPQDMATVPPEQLPGAPPTKATSENPPAPKLVPVAATVIDENNPLEEL